MRKRGASTFRSASSTPGKRYVAEIYADGPKANWLDNPLPVTITKRPVTSATRLRVLLAPGGGQAIRIRPSSRIGYRFVNVVNRVPRKHERHGGRTETAISSLQSGVVGYVRP